MTRADKRPVKETEVDTSFHNGEDASHTVRTKHKETYAEYLKKAVETTFASGARAFQQRAQMGDDAGDDKDLKSKKPEEIVPDGERKTVRLGDKVRDASGRQHTRGKASHGPRGTKKHRGKSS